MDSLHAVTHHELLDRRGELVARGAFGELQLPGEVPDGRPADAAGGFHPNELARLLLNRRAVRIALMRNTIQLVTAHDCLALRPLM